MHGSPCIVEEFSHTLISFLYFLEGPLILVMYFSSQLIYLLFLIKKSSLFFDTENKMTF